MKRKLKNQLEKIICKYILQINSPENRHNLKNEIKKYFPNYEFTDETLLDTNDASFRGVDPITKKVILISISPNMKFKIK
jgi:hypothetical protein